MRTTLPMNGRVARVRPRNHPFMPAMRAWGSALSPSGRRRCSESSFGPRQAGSRGRHRPTSTPSANCPRGRPARCAKLEKMQTHSGDFELTTDELRAIAGYAVACAEPALVLFQKACLDDPRPAAALQAARVFTEGAPRSRLQRTAATDAHRAARDATTEAARHAASAAGDAAAAAYLHPLAKATQVRHILGSAAHAARAAELARGDDPVVAEYVITAAAKRATPVVLDVLTRYPRAPKGRSRVAVLMERLDSLLRDPPPTPRVVDDPGPFFHGTKADLRPGELLTPGWRSNYPQDLPRVILARVWSKPRYWAGCRVRAPRLATTASR
jgi:hypothetical protein